MVQGKGRKQRRRPQKYSKNNEQWRCQEQTLSYCNIAKDKEPKPRVSEEAKKEAPMTLGNESEKG